MITSSASMLILLGRVDAVEHENATLRRLLRLPREEWPGDLYTVIQDRCIDNEGDASIKAMEAWCAEVDALLGEPLSTDGGQK